MSATTVRLPRDGGQLTDYVAGRHPYVAATGRPPSSRIAVAAAHVVADPLVDADPTARAQLDWDATLAFRHHLWDCGLGVAEAMDTSQRGNGLGWPAVRELIVRSAAEARACGGRLYCGANTDQDGGGRSTTSEVLRAYLEQLSLIEEADATPVMMASRDLARIASDVDDYLYVYDGALERAGRPVVLHWLGEAFDPQLAGYWGHRNPKDAVDTVLGLIERRAARIDGIKLSLLDAGLERAVRARLPAGVRLYTGDDFNFRELIAGDEDGHSDALLGAFDPLAVVASAALTALDEGDETRYHALFEPAERLAREVFRAPTHNYKTGVVFLAYLMGHQQHFRMVAGMESARSVVHLARVFVLADGAGLFADPEDAVRRLRPVLATAGITP